MPSDPGTALVVFGAQDYKRGRKRVADNPRGPAPPAPKPRYTRRLSDKILIAFHHACDDGDIHVAQRLLDVLDFMMRRPPAATDVRNRHAIESLVAAHERLWQMRHPDVPGEPLA